MDHQAGSSRVATFRAAWFKRAVIASLTGVVGLACLVLVQRQFNGSCRHEQEQLGQQVQAVTDPLFAHDALRIDARVMCPSASWESRGVEVRYQLPPTPRAVVRARLVQAGWIDLGGQMPVVTADHRYVAYFDDDEQPDGTRYRLRIRAWSDRGQ